MKVNPSTPSIRKAGSGRPKGATSFEEVPLSALTNIFDPDDNIMVSRVWLSKKGLNTALEKCKELNSPPR